MMKRSLLISIILLFLTSCGMVQSIVKSTFPYTTTLTIPQSANIGATHSAISTATSFDQNFTKSGNNGERVSEVSIISAKLQSTTPSDFNLGNLSEVKVYVSKNNGNDEVLVASRKDITASVGNSLVLDIDNSHFLDQLVREPDIRIRMSYQLRKKAATDVSVHLVLGLNAYPGEK